MAAVTFADLKTRILKEADAESTSGQSLYFEAIGNAIISAIRYYEGTRFWFLEKTANITILNTQTLIALPTDFKSLIQLRLRVGNEWLTDRNGFELVSYDRLKELATDATATGQPRYCALYSNAVVVDRAVDKNYTIEVTYCRGDVNYPSADGSTSIWFDDGVELIRYKALEIFYRDKKQAEDKAQFYKVAADDFENKLKQRSNTRQQRYRLA